MSVAGMAAAGALASAATGLIDTGVNAGLTVWSNKKNEQLMRESWAREDNAVQRRVADLKAAGLSPVLAAGSAAASSGPISVKAPQINTSAALNNALSTASAIKGLKYQDLQNEFMQKQIDNFGLPDWAVYMQNLFGDKWTDMVRGFGDKVYNWLFKDPNGLGAAIGRIGDKSNSSGTSSVNPVGVPYSRPDLPTDFKLKSREVKKFENVETSNSAAKTVLESAGVDTSKPAIESDAKSFGVSESFAKDARYFVDVMIKDGKASTENIDRLSYSLSIRFNYNFDDVRMYITDLVREARKH